MENTSSSTLTVQKQDRSLWKLRGLTLFIAAWTALLFCYFIALLLYTDRMCDQSWLLYAAQLVLSGAHISGPQLVETNPPLIIWFSTIPVFLAHLLHFDSYIMLKVVVSIMIVGSVAWSARVLHAAGILTGLPFSHVVLCSLVSAELCLGWLQYGQREHLLVILILPYILSAIFSDKTKLPFAELCLLGIAGGIAVCFKPQHVLILVAIELFLAAWTRSLRRLRSPDFIAAVFAIAAYIVLVRLAVPHFFSMTLPLLRDTYWAFGPYSTWHLIKEQYFFDTFFLISLAVFVWRRRRLQSAKAIGLFLACSLASAIAYYSQHTGDLGGNRTYPQHAFLLLAILWIVIEISAPTLKKSWRFDSTFAVATLLFALMLVPPLMIFGSVFAKSEWLSERFPIAVFAKYPPQTPVLLLSPELDAFPAVMHDHLVWASRFPCLWLIPAIVQSEVAEAGGPKPKKIMPPALVAKLAALQREDTTEDFRRWKPTVVIAEHCSKAHACLSMADTDFDPVPWFLKSPAFASEWAHYRLQYSHENYDVYTRTQ